MRPLPFLVALSFTAVGFLGTFASELVPAERAVSLPDAMRSGPGSHVLVRAFLERVRTLAGGAAVATATDCAGTSAAVYLPQGAPRNASFSLVVLDASVASYQGKPELVVERPDRVRFANEAAAIATPDELMADWRSFACRSVGVTGTVLWGHLTPGDGRNAELGLLTTGPDLAVTLHSEAFLELNLEAGVRATFIGTVAANPTGDGPVLHVRL